MFRHRFDRSTKPLRIELGDGSLLLMRGATQRNWKHGIAKERRPRGLQMWTFQANGGARRFYERHGFVVMEATDGDNEERAPDVRNEWHADATERAP